MRSIIIASAFMIAGCQTFFLPPYSEDIHSQLAEASEGIQRIDVMLTDAERRSAADLEPVFIDVLTHLRQARAGAEARANTASTRFARRSGRIITENIESCQSAVKAAFERAKVNTLDHDGMTGLMVPQTCDFPKIEEDLLPK